MKNETTKKLTLVFFVTLVSFFILAPILASAAGLVPCGGPEEPECDLCQFLLMIKNVMDLILKLGGVICFLIVVSGGILLLVAGGSENLIAIGKKILTSAIIGLVIILSSWLIISAILGATGYNAADNWYEFECKMPSPPPPPPPPPPLPPTYLACDGNFDCVITEGEGVDECSPEGSKCLSHLECGRDGECILVEGEGPDKDGCTSQGQACSAWHLDCNPVSLMCEKALGGGKDRCEVIGIKCRTYYLKCDENNMCIKIWDKTGTDECGEEGEECPTNPACNDDEDNDGDKRIDFPDDPGCTSKDDNSEREYDGPQCDNGRDDDGDNKMDYKADGTGDPECTSSDDNDEANGVEPCTEDRDCDLGYICKTLEGGQKSCVPGCRKDPDCPEGQICQGGSCINSCRGEGEVCFQDDPRCPGGNCTEYKCCSGYYCEEKTLFRPKTYCRKETEPPPPPPDPFEGYDTEQIDDRQKEHASQALMDLLACMKDKLPDEAREISSISDDGILSDPVRCDYLNCSGNIRGGCDGCAHSYNSCHYGGKNCNTQERFSYAVDFAKEGYCDQIKTAAFECNAEAFVNYEGNHVHVSLNKPSGCECNEAAVGKPCL